MAKIFEMLMREVILPGLKDTAIILTPITFVFLIFCFYKYIRQKQTLSNFIKYGMWVGSGQK